MRHSRIEIYIHFIWSTWDREPLILPGIERDLYRCIEAEAKKFKCSVLALNGVENHVHVLLQMPTTATIAEVVQAMKGGSSVLANELLGSKANFRWSSAYAAFSIARWDKKKLIGYIENQKEHHATNTDKPPLELPSDVLVPENDHQ
ncbi:hypothetical protein IAD21_03352 [Abditibacteriota bacterium]|nr:hypothetical protein IAD21_03352 [Abditibacteriota bacterium]